MNFFFKLNSKEYDHHLTIPRFTNSGKNLNNLNLYSLNIAKGDSLNYWNFNKVNNNEKFFFRIQKEIEENNDFFYIGDEQICNLLFNSKKTEMNIIENFLITHPPFRANTRISKKNLGFSSYQSDYPISMIKKRGSIVSPVQTLLNFQAEINKIFFVNLYYKPIKEKFKYYLICYNSKKILHSDFIFTNSINEIDIDKKFIKKDIFFVTNDYVGIPIYFSDKNGHLSLEHTHPPHEYVFGKNKFKVITEFKKVFHEIINKNNL